MKLTPKKLAELKALDWPKSMCLFEDRFPDIPVRTIECARVEKLVREAITDLIADLEDAQKELENERARGIHTCHDNCTRALKAEQERDALRSQLDRVTWALEHLLERGIAPPDRNCSCHISPPCNDCVEWSGLREAVEHAESALAAVTPAGQKGGE